MGRNKREETSGGALRRHASTHGAGGQQAGGQQAGGQQAGGQQAGGQQTGHELESVQAETVPAAVRALEAHRVVQRAVGQELLALDGCKHKHKHKHKHANERWMLVLSKYNAASRLCASVEGGCGGVVSVVQIIEYVNKNLADPLRNEQR